MVLDHRITVPRPTCGLGHNHSDQWPGELPSLASRSTLCRKMGSPGSPKHCGQGKCRGVCGLRRQGHQEEDVWGGGDDSRIPGNREGPRNWDGDEWECPPPLVPGTPLTQSPDTVLTSPTFVEQLSIIEVPELVWDKDLPPYTPPPPLRVT